MEASSFTDDDVSSQAFVGRVGRGRSMKKFQARGAGCERDVRALFESARSRRQGRISCYEAAASQRGVIHIGRRLARRASKQENLHTTSRRQTGVRVRARRCPFRGRTNSESRRDPLAPAGADVRRGPRDAHCARAAPRLARGSRLRASRAASDRDIPCALTENTSITSSQSLADPITDKLSRRKEGIRVRV